MSDKMTSVKTALFCYEGRDFLRFRVQIDIADSFGKPEIKSISQLLSMNHSELTFDGNITCNM